MSEEVEGIMKGLEITGESPLAGSHSAGGARIALSWSKITAACSSSASICDQVAPVLIVVAARLCASSKATRRTRIFSTCA